MRISTFLSVISISSLISGCSAEFEHWDDVPEEEQLIPADEAPELRDENGVPSVTLIDGPMPQLLRGSLSAGITESEAEELHWPDSPEELTSESDVTSSSLVLYDDGRFDYYGGAWGRSYNVAVSQMCQGYDRSHADAYTLTGSGNCYVVKWYSQDTRDCRAVVHVGVPPFKSGTCVWQTYANEVGYYSYTAANTNNAQQNTTNTQLILQAGDRIEIGTCGLPNASASGDTYLRLIGPDGQVAANDDACSSLSSYMIYTVPTDGKYQIKAGCYSSGSCSGTVAWRKI